MARIWETKKGIGIVASGIVVLIFFLLLSSTFGQVPRRDESLWQFEGKISPVLRDEIASLPGRAKAHDEPAIPVIVQVDPGFFVHNEILRRRSARASESNALSLIHSYVARLTAAQIRQLLSSDVVEYVTLDMVLRSTSDEEDLAELKGSIRSTSDQEDLAELNSNIALMTIGADRARAWGFDGSGITVAVFDSGIDSHPDLAAGQIRLAIDFTSGQPMILSSIGDQYGHGTAVAGLIAGNGIQSSGRYAGVAPKAQLIDIKVVGADGAGLTSNLIKAIDWLVENKETYNTRVANLSLGHAPVESYKNDPLCRAVERLVAAGVVTVVSAGNLGKLPNYPKIWGAINSPGNNPAVITVYPVNTRGTVSSSDDMATSFGSRGPTYLDNMFKPDLCAPGNAIASLLVPGSAIEANSRYLVGYPGYVSLSGSSMATAFVSGTAALVLQANGDLTPEAVKLILLLSAVKLQQPHMLEQGNGLVDAGAAVEVAQALKYGQSLSWPGAAFAFGNTIAYSHRFQQAPCWGNGAAWVEKVNQNEDTSVHEDIQLSIGGTVWKDSSQAWTSGVFWSDGLFWTDGVVWSDLTSDGVFWSDAVFWTDHISSDNFPQADP